MKKIGVMTLDSRSYNYGGILQEYALCHILEEAGFDTKIIDFDLPSEIYTFSYKRSLLNLNIDKLTDKFKQRHKNISKIDVSSYVSLRHEKFDQFRTEYLKLSKRYTSKNISDADNEFDLFICGSDQIWNPDFNVPEFFLDFVLGSQRKIIYGASLGRDELTKRQLSIYKKMMLDLDHISVREDNAKTILQPLASSEIEVVLDPTLLVQPNKWRELVRIPQKMDFKYIFCYFLDNNTEKQKAANKAAQELGLKIVTIPFLHDRYEKQSETFGDYRFCEIGPQEFLGLICNANLILTDSFHATVFSILFKKDFWTFSRDCGTYNMDSRIVTLLRYFELSDRMAGVGKGQYDEPCKYQEKYEQFEQKKTVSLKFLNDAIF